VSTWRKCRSCFVGAYVAGSALALAGCSAPADRNVQPAADSVAAGSPQADSALDTLIAGSPDDTSLAMRRTASQSLRLSPLADSLARFLVFVPITQRWYAAASRGQRLVVDIGRVDTVIGDNPVRQAAYREAVAKLAPVVTGERLRLRGPWGSDDVTVSGFDAWSGRIVATLKAPAHIDSLARARDWLPAVAVRSDAPAEPRRATCERAPIPAHIDARLSAVRDSVLRDLRAGKDLPRIARLSRTLKDASSRISGCFENASAILFVSLSAGDYEWVRQRAFAVDSAGRVRQLGVRDLRFKAHEALGAFDADEDGDDDLAVRGRTINSGALVILRLVEAPPPGAPSGAAPVAAARLERAAAGFAWER
jgi:hypothetical protein